MESFLLLIKKLTETQSGTVTLLLSLISYAMVLDFISGVIGAKINKDIEFKSKIGINGLMKKIIVYFFLIMFIPLTTMFSIESGLLLLNTFYFGFLIMEIQSIIENLDKMGIKVEIFKKIIELIKNKGGK